MMFLARSTRYSLRWTSPIGLLDLAFSQLAIASFVLDKEWAVPSLLHACYWRAGNCIGLLSDTTLRRDIATISLSFVSATSFALILNQHVRLNSPFSGFKIPRS